MHVISSLGYSVSFASTPKTSLSFNNLPSVRVEEYPIIVNGKAKLGKTPWKAHKIEHHHPDRQSIQPRRQGPAKMNRDLLLGHLVFNQFQEGDDVVIETLLAQGKAKVVTAHFGGIPFRGE